MVSRVRWGILAAVAAAVVLAPGGTAGARGRGELWRERDGSDPALAAAVPSLPSLAPLVKQISPAVVNIHTAQVIRPMRGPMPRGPLAQEEDPPEEFWRRFMGGGPEREFRRQSLGSGFIISPDGYAITNNHVVEKATEIKVKLSDGREFLAEIKGRDPKTDIALIRLKSDGALKGVPIAYLGNSDEVQVGDFSIAIGNPFGLDHSVSMGIVSAKERVIGAGPYDDFIQTDASINPGNSGGPLFNLKGEVVGVNTAIVAHGQGIGFSVPINLVKEILPQLDQNGSVSRGWLGVSIQEVTAELASGFKLDRQNGALVNKVFERSPAEKAGLKDGDVVVAVNGRAVESFNQLARFVALVAPGKTATLSVVRDGKERKVAVTVGERPEDEELASLRTSGPPNVGATIDRLGVAAQPITPDLARRHDIARRDGLVVVEVAPDGPAASRGVNVGDVIVEVNRVPVRSLSAYQRAVAAASPGETVLLRLQRGRAAVYVAVPVPK